MKTHLFCNTKLAATLAGLFFLQLLNAQWPQWCGQQRDGASMESNLLKEWPVTGPKLIWTSDTIGDGFSSAIIQDNVIYTTGNIDSAEVMTAIDLNGKLIWQQEIGKSGKENCGSYSTPTIYRGMLFAVTVPGDISCVNSKTGQLEWKINIHNKFGGVGNGRWGKQFCESPLVIDDKVIITPCGKNTTLAALNSNNGEIIWTSESLSDTASYVSPVLIEGAGKKLIVTRTKKNVLALDLNTGKIIWKEKTSGYGYIPFPVNKQVYFSNSDGLGKKLTISEDLSNFNFQWTDSVKVDPMCGQVRLGNRIYGILGNTNGLFCMDWETGKILSINKGISQANLIVADGMIFGYESQNGRVFIVKPNGDNTELISSFKVKSGEGPHLAHMSIANGMLFIRHGKYLMAYDVKQL